MREREREREREKRERETHTHTHVHTETFRLLRLSPFKNVFITSTSAFISW